MIRKNFVEVDLSAIRRNYRLMQQALGENVAVMAVVKADAYGHGLVPVSLALQQEGVCHFAVAIPEEGIALRQAGITGEILVLGQSTPASAQAALEWGLCETVFLPETVEILEKQALLQGKQASIHIKLDTGMNRIGLKTPEEARALVQALEKAPHVRVAGIFTHFADADNPAGEDGLSPATRKQLECFERLRSCFPEDIPNHLCNSALSLLGSRYHAQMIRQGISLYGYPPVPTSLPFTPALRWQTEVSYVKTVYPGESIGYGCAYTASREMRVATVAVGYGDGYHRALSDRGRMLIHGQRVPIVGRVCMDQTMVDVTEVPGVQAGDPAVLIGSQGGETITAEEVAAWADTICYEVLLAITARVPKIDR